MTRINTNVSSLNAQKTLARSNAQLQQALSRLSTGLRINSGKDDPAGLIASETLKADITSTNKAITNSQRANQMITTADSALGQISSLLNDIRGLVSEAANTGALSAEQISANQLQIDSSLEAIDRIARVTSFQGKRLLDGNLDFITSGVSNQQITDLQIDQATFGTQSQIDVAVDVVAAAEKGKLSYNANSISEDVVLEIGGSEGYEAFNFAAGSSVSDIASAINLVSDALGVRATTDAVRATADRAGQTNISAEGGSLKILSKTAGATAGDVGIVFTENTAADPSALAVQVASDGNLVVKLGVTAATTADTLAARNVGNAATLTIAADKAGSAYGNVQLNIVDTGAGATTAAYDYKTKTITVSGNVTGGVTGTALATAINQQLGDLFTATAGGTVGDNITAGNKGTFTGNATDKALSSGNTLAALKAAIQADTGAGHANELFDVSQSTGVLTGSLNKYATSATYGSTNVGLASDLNNGIQILGTEGNDSATINFVKSGANSNLSITYTENTATNGYSTAYMQGVAATLKIAATEQGTQYDGVTIRFNDVGGTDKSVIFDKDAKTLTINYNSATDGTEFTASAIKAKIDATGLFTASVIGDNAGVFSTSQTASTSGGNKYSSINVNLATDANGAITSTAADVVNAINNSADLKGMGITAANLGSSTGTGKVSTGTAYLTQAGVTKTNAYASGSTYAAGGEDSRLSVTAKVAGGTYDGVKIKVYDDASVTAGVNERIAYDANKKELALYVDSGNSTVNDVLARFNTTSNPTEYAMFSLSALGSGEGVLTAGDEGVTSGGVVNSGAAVTTSVDNYAWGSTSPVAGVNASLTLTAKTAGTAYNGITIDIVDDVGAGAETFEFDGSTLTIHAEDGVSTVTQVLTAFAGAAQNIRDLFSLSTLGNGSGAVVAGVGVATLAGGDPTDVVDATKMVENYDQGDEIGSVLSFESSNYGSDKFVSVKALSGSFATYNAEGSATDRDTGADVSLRINGIAAVAKGLDVSFNTSALDMRFSMNADVAAGSRLNFSITGGGAQFQLGPDVLSNQQARIGISSISTTKLGGDTGRLYELRSGGTKSLTGDVAGAASVVEDVIGQITNIRGRLGAFQKTTLDTNIAALTDTVETLTAAQSDIADADFAAESANMTRANILVQSGLTVLSNANQNPQQILRLLQ